MKNRVTKQGVRDLNPVGHNGHKNHGQRCTHFFGRTLVVIGYRWAVDTDYFEAHEEPIYGVRCLHCGETRE